LLGIVLFPAFSQEIYTLEQCKELALKNNAQAKNAELSTEIAAQQKKEAFTKYFPSVSAMGAGFLFDKALLSTEVETGYPAPNDKVQVDMGKNGLIGGVFAMQPVFAGGQIVNGNRLAKTGVEVSYLQKQMTENEVLLATEHYFWQLVSLKEKMKTIENAETMLNRILSDVKVAVDAGLTTRNDLLRIELEQNKLQSGKLKAENGLQILKTAFAQHIGLETDTFDIESPTRTLPSGEGIAPPPLEGAGGRLVERRLEYQLLDKSVEAARLQRDMERGKYLPTVAVGVGYDWVKTDAGRNTAMDMNVGFAVAAVSIPISDWWGGSHAIKRKNLELQTAQITRDENADLLSLQMKQVTNELNEAYKQVLLAQKSIASAEENLKISEDNYNAGVTILSDLLDAQNLLQQSNDQYTEAVTGYYFKMAEYKQVNVLE
jgi:outer membrane protein TolC